MDNKKVSVFGSFVVDLMGRAPHLPRPGETVKGTTFKIGPGGKGSNQGVAAKRAGADVTMITKIGDDEFSNIAIKSFVSEGMDTQFVLRDSEEPTGAALIMVDESTSENEILVTLGACNNITSDDIDKAKETIESSCIFLTQLETNMEAIERAINIAHKGDVNVVLNPAPVQPITEDLLKKVYIITPNEVEASILSGVEVNTVDDAKKAASILMEMGVENVITTLGRKGALVVTPDETIFLEGIKVNAIDTTGAGDAFNGALITALSEGKDIFEAAKFANIAAALSVTKIGTAPAMPYRNEIDEYYKGVK